METYSHVSFPKLSIHISHYLPYVYKYINIEYTFISSVIYVCIMYIFTYIHLCFKKNFSILNLHISEIKICSAVVVWNIEKVQTNINDN